MAEKLNETVTAGERLATVTGAAAPTSGTTGLETQLPGRSSTVTQAADSTGGIDGGNFVQPDIDQDLFLFHQDDTPLMQLMLKAKTINVDSPVVDHFMIDQPRCELTVKEKLTGANKRTDVLKLVAEDQDIPQDYDTIIVKGVNGYDSDGKETPGEDLMLYVVGRDNVSNNPIVMAMNGKKSRSSEEYSTLPDIPAGAKLIMLSKAMYETQKFVSPDLIVPKPTRIYLQKRGMNNIVSDYFDAQKKRIPFTQALIAEQAIMNFKTKGNRTFWVSRKGKCTIKTDIGPQKVYTTEGVRWQFKRILQHTSKWTFEEFIALAKMFFTGEDVPKTALLLAGKNMLEEIQCIDFSKHPEVQISVTTNTLGWSVTRIHTVFGDIDIKREPTLDYLHYSNSGALIGEDRLVHYVYKQQHAFNENVEGEEAKRDGIIVWDGLALKGTCHIWIDGEGVATTGNAVSIAIWDKDTAPTAPLLANGKVFYLLCDCPAISANAQNGQMWQYQGEPDSGSWVEYKGDVYAK